MASWLCRLLNHDAQSCNQVAANQWLVQFQQADAAWNVATSILLSSDRTPRFRAQILKLKNQENGSIVVLETLMVLPEEVIEDQHSDSDISYSRRGEYGRVLLWHTLIVLDFLLHLSDQRVEDARLASDRNRRILRCMLSWVCVDCFAEIIQSSLHAHPLVDFVFKSLQIPSSFDVAIEVLIELVGRHEGLPQVLLFRLPFLRDTLLLPALKKKNEKVIRGIACLRSEIGQAVSLSSYLLGLEADIIKQKKLALDIFCLVFSALLDTLLVRIQNMGRPLPKFGEDVNNPASAEGFTVIFNKAKDEKKTSAGGVTAAPPPKTDYERNKRDQEFDHFQ